MFVNRPPQAASDTSLGQIIIVIRQWQWRVAASNLIVSDLGTAITTPETVLFQLFITMKHKLNNTAIQDICTFGKSILCLGFFKARRATRITKKKMEICGRKHGCVGSALGEVCVIQTMFCRKCIFRMSHQGKNELAAVIDRWKESVFSRKLQLSMNELLLHMLN